MSYEILEHTADARMRVEADTQEELFAEAVRGMIGFSKPKIVGGAEKAERKISLDAPDTTVLLVDFLSEVLTLLHTHKEIYLDIVFKEFSETSLKAELMGVKAQEFNEDIKAVTYHEADVIQNKEGKWSTNLVFDI